MSQLSPPKRLQGRNALVTGSARGIGKAIALRFADEGANVAVNYMENASEAAAVVEAVRSRGVKSFAVKADIGISNDVRNLISQVLDEFKALDILVNNAGRGLSKNFDSIQQEEWERTIAVHLKGVFLTCQLAGQSMRRQKRGSIINISSVAGRVALPYRTIYSTVEAAKDMFTRSLACEWAADGVRVNSIAPGTIRTDLVQENLDKGNLDATSIQERTPLGRFGESAEVAALAAFLASDDASYITGQTIYIDGGWTSWGGWPVKQPAKA
jgi:NAD(P)-dependent dehydrogenase (short-subunit alcohol dehydrogenase family)